jgi:hypothetical protein
MGPLNLHIRRGETFRKVLRWGVGPMVYKAITGATKTAPCVLTVPQHGVPQGWLVAVTNVVGMTDLNAENDPPVASDYRRATVRTPDTIELNGVNAAGYRPYQSGGYLQFFTPVDLTSFRARMQVRAGIDDVDVLLELTTENGGIVIDPDAYTIVLAIPATQTETLAFDPAVYDLEMVGSDGSVTRLAAGTIDTDQDVTR